MTNYVSANARSAVRARNDGRFAVVVLMLITLALMLGGAITCAAGAVTLGVFAICVGFAIGAVTVANAR